MLPTEKRPQGHQYHSRKDCAQQNDLDGCQDNHHRNVCPGRQADAKEPPVGLTRRAKGIGDAEMLKRRRYPRDGQGEYGTGQGSRQPPGHEGQHLGCEAPAKPLTEQGNQLTSYGQCTAREDESAGRLAVAPRPDSEYDRGDDRCGQSDAPGESEGLPERRYRSGWRLLRVVDAALAVVPQLVYQPEKATERRYEELRQRPTACQPAVNPRVRNDAGHDGITIVSELRESGRSAGRRLLR